MMVFVTIPHNLSEDEEALLQKYAKLKKKKKALAAMKTPKLEKPENVGESLKRPAEAAADATEQAKKLLKSGAIKVERDRREQQTFKRLKRAKDSDKPSIGFHPFPQSTGGSSEVTDELHSLDSVRPKPKFNLYENFVSESNSKREDGEKERRPATPRRGNTVYVSGRGLTEQIVNRAFQSVGGIINVSVEPDRNCGFVTFEKVELAEQAINDVNMTMVCSVQLRVMMARRQPAIDALHAPPVGSSTADTASSTNTWSSIAASSSQKGCHRDNRDLVAYDDELF